MPAALSHSAAHSLVGCWSIDQFEGGVGTPYLPWSGGLQGQVGFTLAPKLDFTLKTDVECSVDSARPCAVNVTFRLITGGRRNVMNKGFSFCRGQWGPAGWVMWTRCVPSSSGTR